MDINFNKLGNAKLILDKGEQGTVELVFQDGALTDVTVTPIKENEKPKPHTWHDAWKRRNPSMRELIDKSTPIVNDIKKAQAKIILKKEEEQNSTQEDAQQKVDLFFGKLENAGSLSKAQDIIELDKNGTLDAYVKESHNFWNPRYDKNMKNLNEECSTAYKNWKQDEPRIDKNGNDKR